MKRSMLLTAPCKVFLVSFCYSSLPNNGLRRFSRHYELSSLQCGPCCSGAGERSGRRGKPEVGEGGTER